MKPEKASALSIAYAMKKRALGKNPSAAQEEARAPQPSAHPMDREYAKHLARAVMKKHMYKGGECMADGGEVEVEAYSESGDDLFSAEEPEEMNQGGMVKEEDSKKNVLSRVMARRLSK